jgi:hypothetical protein
MRLYYHVYKNYKGLFKKKHKGNTQMFTIPHIPSNQYFTHGVIVGRMNAPGEEYDGALTFMTITMAEMSKMKQFVDGLQMELGKSYELVEVTPVNVTDQGDLNYLVKVLKKGPHIKSDLDIMYADHATKKLGRKMFLIKGVIDLYTDKVKTNQLGMVAMKKMAFLRRPKVGMPRA